MKLAIEHRVITIIIRELAQSSKMYEFYVIKDIAKVIHAGS